MLPGKSTISQLFNGTRVFVIPFYQRSYVWSDEQWERMLSDMMAIGHQTTDYFLGAIILKQMIMGTSTPGDYKVVIDGQQRLTTLAIFLKVYYLKLNMNAWFERMFILPSGQMAIQHSNIDRANIEKVLGLQTYVEELDGDGSIIKAYNYFSKHLDPQKIDIDRMNYHAHVIDIIIDQNDDEQQIFDTINSLGVDLTTAELLKNHLFTEHTLSEYGTLWAPAFEKDEECISFWAKPLLKGRNKQKNIEAFLNAFLQIKVHEPGLSISAEEKQEYAKISKLFISYKKFIANYYAGREFEFVKELTEYANIYRESLNPDIVEQSLTCEPGLDRINFIIFATDGTTLIPFVMSILKKVSDEDERKAIFEYLEAYIVRRMICKRSTKNYSDLFSEALINANITSAQQLIDYINEKDASNALAMPNNAELLRCMKENEHPNYRGASILYLLESHMRGNAKLSTQLLKYSAYTLEHLMPQKWVNNWPLPQGGDADERTHRIKTLGNFTIITQSLNSTISNDTWINKLKGRKDKGGLIAYASGLLTLEGVLDRAVWDEQTILTRAAWLASKASNIWSSYIQNDKALDEPIFDDDGEVIIDAMTGEERVISRDQTRYVLNGSKPMAKSWFVPYFVKEYIAKHKTMTYAEIKQTFPDTLMDSGYVFQGLICPVSAYEQWDNEYKEKRYHANAPESKLTSADGIEFYVNTQWTLESIQNILKIAKEDKWEVMVKL